MNLIKKWSTPTLREIEEDTRMSETAPFKSDSDVREFFTVSTLQMLSDDDDAVLPNQQTLDKYARVVIENRWHFI
jgi:hypothetical protein